jgi:GPI-anchor transamidase subunit GAA1
MFMWRAATGIPSGPHAAFKAHSIDALGIHALTQKGIRTVEGIDAYHYFGSLLENSLRACNNLLELLHHSCFYYIMLGPDRFLGIAEYIAPQVMLLVSLTLVAAQLTTYGAGEITDAPSSDVQMRTSHDWFSAIRRLLLALATGLAAGSLCTAANAHDIGHTHVTIVVTVFMIVASVAFLRITRSDESNRPSKTASVVTNGVMIVRQDDWVADKVINIAWLLAVMSACTFFNFSLALFSTFALAPACVLCSPTKDAKLAVVALTALPIASLIVVAHVGGFSIIHAFGLLASHHARWRTFALPIVFGIAYPTTLMAMRVASSPTKLKVE